MRIVVFAPIILLLSGNAQCKEDRSFDAAQAFWRQLSDLVDRSLRRSSARI